MTPAALHHLSNGATDAPVLVLAPSLGTDLHLFDAQAAALSDTHRVIRFDLRGHGQSPVLPGPATMADLAGDVVALLDRLGIDRFAYAGVSIGGAIGQQLGLTVPDRLQSLIVIASAAQFGDPTSWTERAALVRTEGTEFLVSSRTGAWFTPDFARQHPDEADRLVAMLRATPREGYATCCEAIATFDIRNQLSHITAPTLVIAGAEDPVTPVPIVQSIAAGLREAQFLTVPGASHLVNAERADTVTDAIRAHLTGRPVPDAIRLGTTGHRQ